MSSQKRNKQSSTTIKLKTLAWTEAAWFIIGLIGLAYITFHGPTLNEHRFELLRAEGIPGMSHSDFVKLKGSIELSQLPDLDNQAKDNFPAAKRALLSLAERLSKKYGDTDQRVVLVRLNLAALYLELGNEQSSRQIWQTELPKIAKPNKDTPIEMLTMLYRLATGYDYRNDTERARYLYMELLRYARLAQAFPTLKTGDSISNISQKLAVQNEIMARWQEAKVNYMDALKIGAQYGVVGANIYRNIKIAEMCNQLGEFKEGLPYAKTGYQAAKDRYGKDAGETENASLEYGRALFGVGDYKQAKLYLSQSIPPMGPSESSYATCMPDAAIANYYLALCSAKTHEAKSKEKMDIAIARLRTSISLLEDQYRDAVKKMHNQENSRTVNWIQQNITVMNDLLRNHFNPESRKSASRRTKRR